MKNLLPANGFLSVIAQWLSVNILALGREMRLSYLPPLMVYVAAGISGLTSIVGTFYVKEKTWAFRRISSHAGILDDVAMGTQNADGAFG